MSQAKIQEAFQYLAVAAGATTQLIAPGEGSVTLGGFLCTTAGTLQVTEGLVAAPGANIAAPFAVVVGTYYPIPAMCPLGAVGVLTGGAAGTFFYG